MSNSGPELRFHHYRVLTDAEGRPRTLGQGGMGVTYLAEDLTLNRAAALKVIRPEFLNRDPTASARFIREAQALAKLAGCPNVAVIYHYGAEAGSHFYAMEFLEGETLEHRVNRTGPLSVADALRLFVQATEALREAHAVDLVHRDVKPSNLMLTPRPPPRGEQLKLIDFGLAKDFGSATATASITINAPLFTPAFASPEQCRYAPADARSDLYSLGVSLWFALLGEPPFHADPARATTGERIWDLQNKHLYTLPPFERLAAARIPAAVGDLLAWTLQKDPADRPQTAADFGDRLRACQRDLLPAGPIPDEPPLPAPGDSRPDALTRLLPGAEIPGRSRQPKSGDILPPGYRLETPLDDSPAPSVFRAVEVTSGKPVLLRLLPDFLPPESVDALRNRIVRFLGAPHPRLRAVFSCQPPPESFLVAEWREHTGTLADLLRQRGRLLPAEVLTIATFLAEVADHAAAHRLDALDLSPAAVLLDLSPAPARPRPADGTLTESLAARVTVDPVLAVLAGSAAGVGATLGRPPLTIGANGAVRALAQLIYEMLNGAPPAPGAAGIHPLPGFGETANTLLHDALRQRDHGFINAGAFVGALFRAVGSPALKLPPRPVVTPAPPPEPRFPAVTPATDRKHPEPGPSENPPVRPAPAWQRPALRFASLALGLGLLGWVAVATLMGRPKTLLVPDRFPTIQAAIDAAQPGETVRVRAKPAGEVYEETLTFKAGINLVGEGMDTTVVRGPAERGNVLTVRDCASGFISDLGFEQTGRAPNAFGVSLEGSAVQLSRCRVRLGGYCGIICTRKDHSSVRDCEVSDSPSSGIWVTDENTVACLWNNHAHGNGISGIAFTQKANGWAGNNVCENNVVCGILVSNAGTAPTLAHNTASGNKETGIKYQNGATGRAEDNVCEGNTKLGIAVIGTGTAPALIRNTAINNTEAGIRFQDGAAGRAVDNLCEPNPKSAIEVLGQGTAPTLVNNRGEPQPH